MQQTMMYRQLEDYYTSFNSTVNLYSMWAKERGFSYHTLFTLYALYHSESGCCQRAICDEFLIPKQTLNSLLKNLEKDRYISYRINEEDRRNKIITLTEAGVRYARPILEDLYELELLVLQKMGETLVQQMIDSNRLFCEKLKETMEET